MGGRAAAEEFRPPQTNGGVARGAVAGTAANQTSEGLGRWRGGGGAGRAKAVVAQATGKQSAGDPEGSGLRRAEAERMGAPDGARLAGWKSGPRDPAAQAVSQRSRERCSPARLQGGQAAGWGGRRWAGCGRGVAAVAPALSDVIGRPPRGPRHLFSVAPRPPQRAPPGAGPAQAVDVTAKFAALGTPRVAATTAWEAAGQQRAQWPRPLTGPAQPGSSSSLPGGAREPPERPGAHGEGAGSRPGRGTRGTKPQNREGPRRAGDRGSRDWEALCPPRSGAHGAHRPGSRASSQPDRARDARSLSRDPCREAALARG